MARIYASVHVYETEKVESRWQRDEDGYPYLVVYLGDATLFIDHSAIPSIIESLQLGKPTDIEACDAV